MPHTHRMKLREPWLRKVCGETLEFRRAFHRPTNLDVNERVYVAIVQSTIAATVTLGGQPLGELLQGADAAFDVTELLEERNRLAIVVGEAVDQEALPFAEVAIEIRAVLS